MRLPIYQQLCCAVVFVLVALTQSWIAVVSGQEIVEIPVLQNAVIDAQDPTSIDFVLPAGKGKAAITNWLSRFRQMGWKVETLDQDSMSAEYALTRGEQTLEIELDDPGFDEAEITISCDSGYQLAIAGASQAKNAVGPKLPPALIKPASQSNALPGEVSLGSVAELDWEIEEGRNPRWWVSPDGKRFACRRHTETGTSLAVDGCELGKWEDIISPVTFSTDSQHHAFVATRRDQDKLWYYLVVDGVPGNAYPELNPEIAFAADSVNVIFGKKTGNNTSILLRPVDPSKDVIETGYHFAAYQDLFFRGPKGAIGYVAAISEREDAVFYDGKQIGQAYPDIKPEYVAVSMDGKCVYFAEISPVKLGLVKDGKIVFEHNQFEQGTINDYSLWLSDNGERMSWAAQLDGQEFMFLDGKQGAAYESVDFPQFSADGSRFAYLAMKQGSPIVVVDGVESERYAMASEPQFSEDGQTVAYYAELDQREFVVVNGKRQQDFERVTTPLLSSDGSVVAYSATEGDEEYMIVNDAVVAKHDVVGSPYFLPKSNKLAWLAYDQEKKWRMVIDRVESFAFEDFEGTIAMSPDGQHVAIVTLSEKGASVLINGKPGRTYDRVLLDQGAHLQFNEKGGCHYLAVRNEELFLVETKILDTRL